MQSRLTLISSDKKEFECPGYIVEKCKTLSDLCFEGFSTEKIQVPYGSNVLAKWINWMKMNHQNPDNWKPLITKSEEWISICWLSFYFNEHQLKEKVLSQVRSQTFGGNTENLLPQFPKAKEDQERIKHLQSLQSMFSAMK